MDLRLQFTYTLEFYGNWGWLPLYYYSEERLDLAVVACKRVCLSEKASVRLVDYTHNVIVHEEFYNQADDPDARDWDSCSSESEDFDLSWKECGF